MPPLCMLKTHKLQFIWRDPIARKILIDIFGNSQFRRCKYLKKQFLDKLESLIMNKFYHTDDTVYKEMWEFIHLKITKNSRKLLNLNNNHFRSTNRAEKIQYLIRKYLKSKPIAQNGNPISILDVGCAEGHITIRVGDYLDLHPSQINGCDVIELSDNHPNKDRFSFKHLKQDSKTRLPYNDNSQDVVLALMSLHHMHDVDLMLKEMHRILKDGGIVIIREHDSVGGKFPTILDVVHGFYGMVWSNPPEFDKFDEYFARYFSHSQLKDFFAKYSLKEVYNDCRKETYPQFHRNKIINPLKYYYGVYRK